jgi:superfamily II DNA helicase RecQ
MSGLSRTPGKRVYGESRTVGSNPTLSATKNMPTALSLLTTVFGYPAFRGAQAEIIDHVASGGDALVLMPTGGGNRCIIKFRR